MGFGVGVLIILTFLSAQRVKAADVVSYVVAKGQRFNQTSTDAPQLGSNNPFRFDSLVLPSAANSLAGAMVQALPSGQPQMLVSSGQGFQFQARFVTFAALNTAAPNGDYRLTMNTAHDAVRSVTLSLVGDRYPNAPRVSNFTAAQNFNASANFVLSWDAFAGATAGDFIQLTIDEADGSGTAFQTPFAGLAGALNGAATSSMIPANTLAPDHAYRGSLLFAKAADTDTPSYPGALGVAAYYRSTQFDLHTAAPSGPDVNAYIVTHQISYFQDSPLALVLDPGNPFRFIAAVAPTSPTSVSGATIVAPNGASKTLSYDAIDGVWRFRQNLATETDFHAAYGPGNYVFSISTAHEGKKTLLLVVGAGLHLDPLHVKNFPSTQIVNAAADFVLTWDPIAAGSANDFVQVLLDDSSGSTVFQTPDIGEPGALNGTTASVRIAAGTLAADGTYAGRLILLRPVSVDSATYPGARGIVRLGAQTFFNLTTVGPAVPAVLAPIGFNAGGHFTFTIRGTLGRQYVIEASSSLQAGTWTTLTTATATADGATIADDQSVGATRRFYRARGSD